MALTTAQGIQLLEDWVYWIMPQKYSPSESVGDDPSGNAARKNNGDSNIWYLSGAWDSQKKHQRIIKVLPGTQFFIVVASSHAIPLEVQKLPNNPIANPTDQNLMDHANAVHALWSGIVININGSDVTSQKQTLPTRVLRPYIRETSWYDDKIFQKHGDYTAPHAVRMATVADVFGLHPAGNAGDRYNITFKGDSAANANLGEDAYSIDVKYSVSVVQPTP